MSSHEPSGPPPIVQSASHTPPHVGPPRLGITFNQLVGSALAAAAAAFGASFLGVAGTIIGASVASVIATVASATYSRSLERTRAVVLSTVTQWSGSTASGPVVDPNAPEPPERGHRPGARLALAAVAVMALTFAALTGVEAVVGKPIAALLGGSDASGTTLSSVGRTGGSDTTPRRSQAPTPTVTPTSTPSVVPSATPSAEPTGTATPPASSPTPSVTPTPTADPTGTPTGP